MHQRSLQPGKKYFLKHTTQTVSAVITEIKTRIDIVTYEPEPNPTSLALNDIGVIKIHTGNPLVFDGYGQNRLTGSFILVEQGTNATVAAGMLHPPSDAAKPEYNDFAIWW
jgi:sulfate adenylyltransferase subunit 1 (EFTu-like GTPase family)